MSTAEISRRKREQRESLIAAAENELGASDDHPDDQRILDLGLEELATQLKKSEGGLTVRRVVEAYIRSACAAHRRTNCLTEILFKEALLDADEKDRQRRSGLNESACGPFWGIPASFKDTYNIQGVDSSIGCSPHCFKPMTEAQDEAEMVKLFRSMGGIPFCKTNIPQTLLAFECRNPVFDATSNPYASGRTCGGSSGGEAALLALRGAPLGWGSDIGGSLRIPAAYSGCYGLKPVVGRWPRTGQRPSVKGFEGIKGVTGPMARSVDDLIYQSRAMIQASQVAYENGKLQGEQLMPLPWREDLLKAKRPLRIGYYTEDGAVKTSPACIRGVEQTVEALRKAGHTLIPFTPPDVPEALRIFVGLTSSEGYERLLSNIGKDPMEPSMQLVTIGSRIPGFLRHLAVWLIKNVLGDKVFGSILTLSRKKSVGETWDLTARRDEYTKRFRQAAWDENKLDCIIAPVQAVPALEHGRTKLLSPLAIATILYNIVDSTVGCMPVTRVDRERDALPPVDQFLAGSPGSWILEKRVYGGADPAYDADKMHGLPVGIQVVGKAWEDEKVLGIMKEISKAIFYS